VQEQIYRRGRGGEQVRPFARAAQVACRSYSLGLQRVLADFGADVPFGQVVEKVQEHYGIRVAASAVRAITQGHGAAFEREADLAAQMPARGVAWVVAEMDGSMIPTVQIAAGRGDKRRRREVSWQEARLALAGVGGSVERYYGATMGSVEQAGRQWRACAVRAGAGRNTHIHCVGDGASWIINQAREQFGGQGRYLVDYYHVSAYLAAAAAVVAPTQASAFRRAQQQRLKENQVEAVRAELAPHGEAMSLPDAEAPVRVCLRYLSNHLEYLDYQGAIAAGWPIGSGEIESGHRTVIQARLKVSGAWWREENAEKMLALRVGRANGEWQSYWARQRQAHA